MTIRFLILAISISGVLALRAHYGHDHQMEYANIPAPEDVAEIPEDAERSESGLAWKVLRPGAGGRKPTEADLVSAHYTGWTAGGRAFDTTRLGASRPAKLLLDEIIDGLSEGFQLMTKGEKRRFWIPAELGYGEKPNKSGPHGMLVFEVELVDLGDKPKIPDDVIRTKSGTAFKVLVEGDGEQSPVEGDAVAYHLSARSLGGDVIVDTTKRPEAPSSPLTGLDPEVQEQLKLMTIGERRRIWVRNERMLGGLMVVDLELISIENGRPTGEGSEGKGVGCSPERVPRPEPDSHAASDGG